MNEQLSYGPDAFESQASTPQQAERDLARLAFQSEKAADSVNESEASVKQRNGLVYAQDQEQYKPFVDEATAMIKAAIAGNFAILDGLPPEFSEALRVRIESHGGTTPAEEVEKMISVACTGLAQTTRGVGSMNNE